MRNDPMKHLRTLSQIGATALVATGFIGLNPNANAYLVAYEGFDYAAGAQLNTLAGGYGWKAGDWWRSGGTLDNSQIVAGSFSYDDGFGNVVTATGNRLHSTGDGVSDALPGAPSSNSSQSPYRRLATDLGTVGNSTTWISFMSLRTGLPAATPYNDAEGNNYYGRAAGMQLFYNSSATSTAQGTELVSVGRGTVNAEPAGTANDTWALLYHGNAADTKASTDSFLTPTKANSTADFILMRVDHVNGVSNPYDDSLSVWLNPRLDNEGLLGAPTLTLAPGDWTDVDRDLAFNVIRIFAGNYNSTVDNYGSIEVDEIKIGTQFLDVTIAPIPEPSTLALFGLGSLALIHRLRRK
jgi:hypothetical protein